MANLDAFIDDFNEDGFRDRIEKVFVNVINFLRVVAKNNRQDEIDISMLDYTDFNNNQDLFHFLDENGFVENAKYDDFDDVAKNYFLEYWIGNAPDIALKYICDNILTDVEMRSDGFWLYLRDREELAVFFDDRGRDATARDVAKHVFSEDIWDPYWDTTSDVYRDVIEDLDEVLPNPRFVVVDVAGCIDRHFTGSTLTVFHSVSGRRLCKLWKSLGSVFWDPSFFINTQSAFHR